MVSIVPSHNTVPWFNTETLLSSLLINSISWSITTTVFSPDKDFNKSADLLKSLSGENTVVVIDHDMEFIRRLDSNVSVLNQGTVLCEGTMETIQKDQKVIDVYLAR